ncbi:hypothetical protein AwWohl_03280 [Gammaproteobacteria bacterium]|nr:hypothetical protein AwWohl_03280 [Gammaproteobacteria bacterium]
MNQKNHANTNDQVDDQQVDDQAVSDQLVDNQQLYDQPDDNHNVLDTLGVNAQISDVNPNDLSDLSELPELPSTEELLAQLKILSAEKDANWNKYLSAEAEMANLRRRNERDLSEAHKFAVDKFVRELLPIVDSMELGITAAIKNDHETKNNENHALKEFIVGSELLHNMFVSALVKFGVKLVDPVGEKLNPERHQAITLQPSDEYASGHVTQVVQKGYLLNERLIRPAMVIVAQ